MEPHFRRHPWLGDIDALIQTTGDEQLWIAEPTHRTLEHIGGGLIRISEAASDVLLDLLTAEPPTLPVGAWRLDHEAGSERVTRASAFGGFEPEYPTPPPDRIHMHPDSAARVELANRLRDASLNEAAARLTDNPDDV